MKTLLFLLLFPALAMATDITVTGLGTTSDEATQSALRSAVEFASGVYIHSTTTVVDSALASDKIIAASQARVDNYKVLSKKKMEDGAFLVTLVASIEPRTLSFAPRGQQGRFSKDKSEQDYNIVANKLTQLRESADLLGTMKNAKLEDMYIINYLGYRIVTAGLKEIKVTLRYSISPNPFFWDTYYKIVDHVKESNPSDKSVKLCLGSNCSKPVAINPELLEYALAARATKITFSFDDTTIFNSERITLYDSNISVEEVHCSDNIYKYPLEIVPKISGEKAFWMPWYGTSYGSGTASALGEPLKEAGKFTGTATFSDPIFVKNLYRLKAKFVFPDAGGVRKNFGSCNFSWAPASESKPVKTFKRAARKKTAAPSSGNEGEKDISGL